MSSTNQCCEMEDFVAKISAGLLMYRVCQGRLQVFLGHPGGPYFKKKDKGAWTIPKGEIEPDEEILVAACREFQEETGIAATEPFIELTPIKQKGGKVIHAWAFAGDCDPTKIVSNTFLMEWPPRSGKKVEFPEIDRAKFFDLTQAKEKINPAQIALIDQLETILRDSNVSR